MNTTGLYIDYIYPKLEQAASRTLKLDLLHGDDQPTYTATNTGKAITATLCKKGRTHVCSPYLTLERYPRSTVGKKESDLATKKGLSLLQCAPKRSRTRSPLSSDLMCDRYTLTSHLSEIPAALSGRRCIRANRAFSLGLA